MGWCLHSDHYFHYKLYNLSTYYNEGECTIKDLEVQGSNKFINFGSYPLFLLSYRLLNAHHTVTRSSNLLISLSTHKQPLTDQPPPAAAPMDLCPLPGLVLSPAYLLAVSGINTLHLCDAPGGLGVVKWTQLCKRGDRGGWGLSIQSYAAHTAALRQDQE